MQHKMCFVSLGAEHWHTLMCSIFLVLELLCAEAPCLTELDNLSRRENLVMTSSYEQANVRPFDHLTKRNGGSGDETGFVDD